MKIVIIISHYYIHGSHMERLNDLLDLTPILVVDTINI